MINNPVEDFIQRFLHLDQKYKHQKRSLVQIFPTLVLQNYVLKFISVWFYSTSLRVLLLKVSSSRTQTKLFFGASGRYNKNW